MGFRSVRGNFCIFVVCIAFSLPRLVRKLMVPDSISHFKAHANNIEHKDVMGLTVKTGNINSSLVNSVEIAVQALERRPACRNCSLVVVLYNQDLRRRYIPMPDPQTGLIFMRYHDLGRPAGARMIGSGQCVTCGAHSPLKPCQSCGVAMACESGQCLRNSLDSKANRSDAIERHGACPGRAQYSRKH